MPLYTGVLAPSHTTGPAQTTGLKTDDHTTLLAKRTCVHQPTGNTRMAYVPVKELTVLWLYLLRWVLRSGSGFVDALTGHWKLGMATV